MSVFTRRLPRLREDGSAPTGCRCDISCSSSEHVVQRLHSYLVLPGCERTKVKHDLHV